MESLIDDFFPNGHLRSSPTTQMKTNNSLARTSSFDVHSPCYHNSDFEMALYCIHFGRPEFCGKTTTNPLTCHPSSLTRPPSIIHRALALLQNVDSSKFLGHLLCRFDIFGFLAFVGSSLTWNTFLLGGHHLEMQFLGEKEKYNAAKSPHHNDGKNFAVNKVWFKVAKGERKTAVNCNYRAISGNCLVFSWLTFVVSNF